MKKTLRKKRSPQPVTAAEHHEQAATAEGRPVIAEAAAAHSDVGDHGDLLSPLSSYIRRYLVCNDHQLTVLALWTLYTWCYNYFPTASYLDIHSPGPQSGKSRCLKILSELCCQPDLIAGADSRTARHRLLRPCRTVEQIAAGKQTGPHTFLFDDFHLALGTSERQPLLALLNSGTGISNYSVLSADYMVFGPKAFAAGAPLPRSLASRCIPIILRRNKPSEKANYFALGLQNENNDRAFQLRSSLERWAEANREPLQQANPHAVTDPPEGLIPAQRDCAEPLLRIADCVGGGWPQKARDAIALLFDLAQFDPGAQILYDIRLCFLAKNNPDRLSTHDILAWLAAIEDRQWTTRAWNPANGQQLGALLHPFRIRSRNLYFGRKKILKGYKLRQFEDVWERYLRPLCANANHEPETASEADDETKTSGLKTSASDPLAPNSCEINASSGLAE